MKDLVIKVCGMREPANIAAVANLPIDYLGFIFYEKSPRFITRPIVLQKPTIRKVGVFVNAPLHFVISKIIENQLDIVQLHGKETPQYVADLRAQIATQKLHADFPIWKAFSVDADFDFTITDAYAGLASSFLFDTKTPKGGGSGEKFDWSILDRYRGKTPFMLAGGISEEDAASILDLKTKRPELLGVDLNSRFEIEPALKDIPRLQRFVNTIVNSP
jgi:phosphoribosylanthranilate isomerase